MLVLSRAGARALDDAAIRELGLPGVVLMENAAVALASACDALIASRGLSRVVICCGPGNNGGDGLALARQLACRGVDALILATAPLATMKGDAGVNAAAVESLGLRVIDPIVAMAPQAALEIMLEDGPIAPTAEEARRILIVDALLGTGLDRPVAGPMAQMVAWVNAMRSRGATVLAADIPTGLDADTGLPTGGPCVTADFTVTFAAPKRGFLNPASRPYTGTVAVGHIGVPMTFVARFADARDEG